MIRYGKSDGEYYFFTNNNNELEDTLMKSIITLAISILKGSINQ